MRRRRRHEAAAAAAAAAAAQGSCFALTLACCTSAHWIRTPVPLPPVAL